MIHTTETKLMRYTYIISIACYMFRDCLEGLHFLLDSGAAVSVDLLCSIAWTPQMAGRQQRGEEAVVQGIEVPILW